MEISEIKDKILKENEGCVFFKADLHVHTPASKDYKSPAVRGAEIIKQAISQNIQILGVTDHNSVEYCEEVILASKNTKVTVFPGFEVNVAGGKV